MSLLGLATLSAQKVLPKTGNTTLTQAEFNAVEINGVTFQDLAETNGELSEMRNLFGVNLTYEYVNDDPVIYKNFGNDDIAITFNSDDGEYFYPSSIDFISNLASIKIKEILFRLGDNLSSRDSALLINQTYGGFVFVDESTGTSSWGILIENDIVTRIEFNTLL